MLTFYNSVNILDNYLLSISEKEMKAPCHETLAMACVLIAAKLDHAGTNELNIYQSAPAGLTGQEIRKFFLPDVMSRRNEFRPDILQVNLPPPHFGKVTNGTVTFENEKS